MPTSMRLILDTNEYIFGLDQTSGQVWSIKLMQTLPRLIAERDFTLFVPDIIRAEVQRNLGYRFVSDFYRFLTSSPKIAYGSLFDVPTVLFQKYTALGLKPGDATIAAFAEWVDADFLISDNRDIYRELKVDKFMTCTAEDFLRLVESDEIDRVIEQLRARRT